VGTESSRGLVETTIERLNADESLSRNDIKTAMASLTIGSGSAAVVLCDREISRTGNRLLGGVVHANTEGCELCQSEGLSEVMHTDSETLMREGIATAKAAFAEFLEHLDWPVDRLDKTFCHQVGSAHRKLMLEAFAVDPAADFTTLQTLGNTGSVALPMTAAMGIEQGHVSPGDRVALLGIGSGINVVMLGVEWQRSLVEGGRSLAGPHSGAVALRDSLGHRGDDSPRSPSAVRSPGR
jgi:3-oxoacyl-[acyl-carrier-protein] synthase-3